SGEMAFAYFIGHAPRGNPHVPLLNGGDTAVTWCFVLLFLATAGAGARGGGAGLPRPKAWDPAKNYFGHAPRTAGGIAPLGLCAVELRAQLVLGALEDAPAARGELAARAVDVEGEHRHRRPVRIALAPMARLRRALERARDGRR